MNIMFACVVVLVMSWLIPADRAVADTLMPGGKVSENKAVTIVIEPPEGREKEFLEEFVKSQALYMKAYGAQSATGVKVINLLPTKLGEPLIHLIIYQDATAYERATRIFSSRDEFSLYLNEHAKRFGGYKIAREFMVNSQIYSSHVLIE